MGKERERGRCDGKEREGNNGEREPAWHNDDGEVGFISQNSHRAADPLLSALLLYMAHLRNGKEIFVSVSLCMGVRLCLK